MEKGQGGGGNSLPFLSIAKGEKACSFLCINFSACWTCVMSDSLKQVSHLCVKCTSELKQFSEEFVKLLIEKIKTREGKEWLTSPFQEEGKRLFYLAS